MADSASITGTIGGVATPIFIGTPGLPGAGAIDSAINTIAAEQSGASSLLDTVNGFLTGGQPVPGDSTIMNILNGTPEKNQGAPWYSFMADYFFRAAVMIIGLIFIAVGLSMFKQPAVIQETVAGAKRAHKAIKGLKP